MARMWSRPEHSRNGQDRPVTTAGTRAIDLVRRSGVEHRDHSCEPSEGHLREREARPVVATDAAGRHRRPGVRPGQGLVSAGRRGVQLELAPNDLASLTRSP